MRALFLFLIFANVAFLAWSRYFSPPDAGADPLPLSRQIEPEKLKVVPPAEAPAPSAPAKPAAPVPPQGGAAAAIASRCMEWGSFTLADAPRAERAIEPLGLGDRLGQRRTEETAGWWVYIPPQSGRQGALRKAAELKGLGIDEYFIVSDESDLRWAVSLGVFRNQEAAQARLDTLRDRGVKSAQMGARETHVPKVWLQVRGVDAALEARLRDVARQVEGSELRPCASS